MSGLGPLGIGIIVAFIVFILFVMIEIYFFISKKKKRRTRDRRGLMMMMMSREETHQRSCEVVIVHGVSDDKAYASSEISNAENVMKWPSIGFMKTKMKKCVNWLILRSIGIAKDCVIMLQWNLLKIRYYISRESIDGNTGGINGNRDSVSESTDVMVAMDMKKKKKKHGVEIMISDGFRAHKEEEGQERKIREGCEEEGEEQREEGEDDDEDIFKIGGLWGPPRLLFTITEETKEEMELELDEEKKPEDDNEEEEEEEEEVVVVNSRGKNSDGNSRRGSGASSLSSSTEFLQLLMVPSPSSCSSPYLTPPSSPPFTTPLGSPASSSSSSSAVALSKLHLPPSCLSIPSSSSSSFEFDNVSSSSSSSTNSCSSPLPQNRPSFDETSSSLSSSSSASFSSSSSSSQSFSPPPLMAPKYQQRGGPLNLLFHEPLPSTASLSPSSSLYHAHIRRVHPISPPQNPISSSSSFKKSPSAELSSVLSPSSACTNCPPRFVIPAFSKPTTPSPFRHVFQQKLCNGHRVTLPIQ